MTGSRKIKKARDEIAEVAAGMARDLEGKPVTKEVTEKLDKLAEAVERVAFGDEYSYGYHHHDHDGRRRAGFE